MKKLVIIAAIACAASLCLAGPLDSVWKTPMNGTVAWTNSGGYKVSIESIMVTFPAGTANTTTVYTVENIYTNGAVQHTYTNTVSTDNDAAMVTFLFESNGGKIPVCENGVLIIENTDTNTAFVTFAKSLQ